MKNVFDVTRAYTCLTADNLANVNKKYGYFCDNAYDLVRAVEKGRTNAHCLYGELIEVKDACENKRFVVNAFGYKEPIVFALAYMFDDDCLDEGRY